ncbi:histone-lysine N-methyltransferase SETMAR-like [Octopus bimaculoides]|uniref:histone-lysine N-methyltransferase SETMAR-like n=1 Tax=Octopus bimaculoides TaxID=37653 RepID=UPI00071D2B81|nr:histone-lysine N-methyltransferase SETMAR-like [Octopus bimaculoides]|eukprot:XP_014781989.1 PREDICTED: histone-lysine N-methyltransferase SETMAR-like [Octopus bimaculoides]
MEDQAERYRHLMLFYFRKGKKATETCRKLCNVYGKNAVSERVCQKWFARFRSGNFSVRNAPHSSRRKEIDIDQLRAVVKQSCSLTSRQIADILNISKTSVENEFHKLGYFSKVDVSVPHKLTEANLVQRVSICDSLLKKENNEPFLRRIITGERKWVVYNNVKRRRSWKKAGYSPKRTPKVGLHTKKVLLSICWDWKCVIFFALRPLNKTINLEVYCEQLDKLNTALHKKWPKLVNRKGVVFHYDNTKPHTALITRQKLLRLE